VKIEGVVTGRNQFMESRLELNTDIFCFAEHFRTALLGSTGLRTAFLIELRVYFADKVLLRAGLALSLVKVFQVAPVFEIDGCCKGILSVAYLFLHRFFHSC
jgi:hypothetical protein